jgi:hypothetical protein
LELCPEYPKSSGLPFWHCLCYSCTSVFIRFFCRKECPKISPSITKVCISNPSFLLFLLLLDLFWFLTRPSLCSLNTVRLTHRPKYMTVVILIGIAFAIPFESLTHLFSRAFLARKNTVTPAMGKNIVFDRCGHCRDSKSTRRRSKRFGNGICFCGRSRDLLFADDVPSASDATTGSFFVGKILADRAFGAYDRVYRGIFAHHDTRNKRVFSACFCCFFWWSLLSVWCVAFENARTNGNVFVEKGEENGKFKMKNAEFSSCFL